jgi:hypothetical protein
MPFQISDPIYQTFDLPQADATYNPDTDEATTVTIRQARQHEHANRMDQWGKFERKYSTLAPEEVKVIQELSYEAIKMLEARITLVESNILREDGKKELFPSKKNENGKPILDMTAKEFEEAWGYLPPDVATEIHKKIIEVNPQWGGARGE